MSAAEEPRSTFERALARRTEELSNTQAERAAELAQQGAGRGVRTRRVTLVRVAAVALALFFARLVLCGTPGRRGNEPIGAGAVATADGAGVGSSAAAFLPRAEAATMRESAAPPSPEPKAEAPAASSRPATRSAPRHAQPHQSPQGPGEPRESLPLLISADDAHDEFAAEVGLASAASAAPMPVFNVGTRLRATLEAPLRTGSTLAPATAVLAEDIRAGDQVLLKAGTRLAGSAFATPNDDRVQILWRALVREGRTLAIQAETLGPDGAPGIAGKVIRRHRKGVLRRIGSTLTATAGEAAGYAVPFGDTALERAGAVLASKAGRELGDLGAGREWLQADTVVELKAGAPLVVYLSADLALGEAGVR